MGAEVSKQSNLFLPLGKVRMGYPSGEARWGLKSNSRSNRPSHTRENERGLKMIREVTPNIVISPHLTSPEGEG